MKFSVKTLLVWLRALGQGATLLGLFMVAFIWLSLAFHLTVERSNAERSATQNAGNLARAFEEHLQRSLKDIDRVLLMLRASDERDPAGFSFDKFTFAMPMAGEATLQFTVVDAGGNVRMRSLHVQEREVVNISDRGHFQAQRDATVDELQIGTPTMGRAVARPSVHISRRLRNPDGSFAGIVGATLDPSYFTRFYDSIDIGSDGFVRIVGLDGIIRAVGGSAPEALGADRSSGTLFKRYQEAPSGAYLTRSALSDNVERLIAYRKVRDFPLIVMVGVATKEVFANAIAKQRAYNYIATTLTALILIFVGFSVWDRVKLERMTEELAMQNLRFDAALNHMSQGLCMFDGDEKLVVCNQRYSKIYDLPTELIQPGTSMHDIISYRFAHGTYGGSPAPEYTRRRQTQPSEIQHAPNGRSYLIQRQPMPGGGFVTTHEDITERQRNDAQIAHMARHDALTDLANRTLFMERINEELARMRRGGRGFAVFLLDLDEFKAVNDSLGHPVGDALLKLVADRLRLSTREIDVVARLGGDEFAILQPGDVDPRNGAVALATRIRDAITAPFDLDGHKINIGTSIGIAVAPDDGTDADQLLKNADLALYSAKAEGRDRYCFFEISMEANARARHALERDLRSSIANDEFELHYQPIVEIWSGETHCAEALVRWRHPQRGMIAPNDFISLAEETGLIDALGEWILNKACAEAAGWPSTIKLAVNLSPAQFGRGNLIDIVSGALAKSGLPPARLELEITESVLLQKNAENLAQLHQIQALGVAVVLDDFGTGYSSLSYLNMFPFDKIKIDRSFVHELSSRANSAAIVCAVIGLGQSLNIATTAEGIETEEQLELLRAAGCRLGQGYLFSRPVPAQELKFKHKLQRDGRAA